MKESMEVSVLRLVFKRFRASIMQILKARLLAQLACGSTSLRGAVIILKHQECLPPQGLLHLHPVLQLHQQLIQLQ